MPRLGESVQVTPAQCTGKRRRRTALAAVALAGPLANSVLAVCALAILAIIARYSPGLRIAQDGRSSLVYLLRGMFIMNMGLCVFNMLPISPLDGSRLLRRSLDRLQELRATMSLLLLPLVLYSGALRSTVADAPLLLWTRVRPGVLCASVWGGLS